MMRHDHLAFDSAVESQSTEMPKVWLASIEVKSGDKQRAIDSLVLISYIMQNPARWGLQIRHTE